MIFTSTILLALGSCIVCFLAGALLGYWHGVVAMTEKYRREFADVHWRLFAGRGK